MLKLHSLLDTNRFALAASMTCMMAGADKIKTSTGKTKVNATIPYGIIMARAIKLFEIQTGRRVGLKAGEL